jgi:hypothetical protein
MAKKQTVNKTQAVADYAKTHRKATSAEIVEAMAKAGIHITSGHVANIRSKIKRLRRAKKAAAKPAAGAPGTAAEAAAVEKPTKASDVITLEQIKKVAQTVNTIGGFDRLKELLEVVREVGGMKKFKDLLDAMSTPHMDDIPF